MLKSHTVGGNRVLRGPSTIHAAFAAVGLAVIGLPGVARAAIDPNSGIDFVTVGAVNNPAWTGGGSNNNRGSVGYVYNIGKFEVTTAQWAEFMNAALDRPANDRIPNVIAPFGWGAVSTTPNVAGARRWTVPAGNEMIPTGGISWRTAAIYCNWLHNNKSTDRGAFLSGAYDASTFAYSGSFFTDQLTRSPGARYWIPSLDEWMKAAHYDPAKSNPDGTTGGWWMFSNSSNTQFIFAPPPSMGGNGTANASWNSFTNPGLNPYSVPLGAYVGVTSPWGLYDVAGATGEWTEGYFQSPNEPFPRERYYEGSQWASPISFGNQDRVSAVGGGEFPTYPGASVGLRIASSIPAPGFGSLGLCVFLLSQQRRTRKAHETSCCRNGSVHYRKRRQVAPTAR
jgi:formylglycine-generating enzyme required for sulfatase activity